MLFVHHSGLRRDEKLGLLDAVPRDPKARVASYTSSVLSLLKQQLIHSRIEDLQAGRVAFVRGTIRGTIWIDEGSVHFQQGGKDSILPLGDQDELTFELQGGELSIAIVAAESDGSEHSLSVSLPLAE